MVLAPPTHKVESTGSASLDRIQNNVRTAIEYLRNTYWTTIRAYAELAALATASGAYATLVFVNLSSTILKGGYLLVHFSASGIQNTSNGTVFARVVVDNVPVRGLFQTVVASYSFNVSMVVRVPVTAGAHTVKVEWKTNVATATIDPSTLEEHASLWVEETSS